MTQKSQTNSHNHFIKPKNKHYAKYIHSNLSRVDLNLNQTNF